MAYLALIDACIAILMLSWLRILLRARGEDIPCTARIFSWAIVAVAVVALAGLVVANVLVLKTLDSAFGKQLSPVLFTAWLLAMSAASISFVIAVTAFHTNSKAAAWIRVVPPDQLFFRVGSESTAVKLEPGSVRAMGVFEGAGGLMYIQYLVRDGDRAIGLVVPSTRDAGPAVNGAPLLDGLSGLIAQDGRKLNRYLVQFCESNPRARS
jgi:hypothetical protein